MRCFFNFKQKKSSSDTQESTKFEEKIKRELKQQILQDLEAKPMATNKVAVEGIVETRVEKKKEKDNFWTLLSKWNRLLAALSSISIVIAAMSVYTYLADIGSRHLLVDIISQPSIFLSIVILFAVFMLFILVPVYIPFMIASYINSEFLKDDLGNNKDIIKARGKTYLISIFFTTLINIIIVLLIIFKKEILSRIPPILESWFFPSFLLIIFILVCIMMLWITHAQCIKHVKNFHLISWIESSFIYFVINMISSSSIIFALSITIEWFDNSTSWFYLGLFAFFIFMSSILAASLVGFELSKNKEDEKKIKKLIWFLPLIIVVVFSLWSFGLEEAKFKQHLFQNLGYIEMPSQARWYLLDKRYLEWNNLNNINKNKIEALSPLKTNYPSLWRNEFKFLPKPSQNHQKNFYSYYPDNAFFGYMAWNLGKIKIFCPSLVEPDKSVIDKCLYIKDDYLQPMPQRI
ncbi:hypothetical protein [Neisseria dumasiana]|uniref:DUF5671 domain-containing protein n=1 Tax=Neisseria dumasiana TaxID=1931275 RepID=A0ABX3WM60_9NEIS|nr:hypothetical protein [Neisseria dumasiana]OSI35637.1 hypothetical protein BV913_04355 [Neisseria dumasiana]UOO84936.1 hypothetical protein LVJ88_02715 [Neisseria dumasiana]